MPCSSLHRLVFTAYFLLLLTPSLTVVTALPPTSQLQTPHKMLQVMSDTPLLDVPQVINAVSTKASEWKEVPLIEKISLLKQIKENTITHADEWNTLSQEARNVNPSDPQHGSARADIQALGPGTFGSYLNGMIESLECIEETGAPPPPLSSRVVDGKVIVTVFPNGLLESLEAVGLKGELILSEREPEQMNYADEVSIGGVAGILGAGNFDAPTEVLCQMFLKGRVCVYKPNPVNQNSHPIIQKIFDPLVRRGYLTFVIGGADVGGALVHHPSINEVVLTGSVNTHDKIVWGSTATEQIQNKSADTPLLKAEVCAELGAVNPWIIVPSDKWSKRSIDNHARHVAAAKMCNNGHTCASPQLLIMAKEWKFRREFLDRVEYWLGLYAGSSPFYPGSAQTHSLFSKHPNAKVIRGESCKEDVFDGQQRPIVIHDAISEDGTDWPSCDVLTREAFCPVLADVPIDISPNDPMSFLRSAVKFAEQNAYGSLTAVILIDDSSIQKNADELDRIITRMKFGVVGVNLSPVQAHSMPRLTWGAFPGYTQSGSGLIGNAHLYKQPEKTVLRAPFHWLGRGVMCIMPPSKHDLVWCKLARYKLRPGFVSQASLFVALFLGLGKK